MKFLPPLGRSTDDVSEHSADCGEQASHSKSRRIKFLQGAAVFLVMFVTLWWLLSRGEEDTE